jgi:hypothetical protein
MTTLAKPRLEVQTINSHHQGAEFGVVLLEDSDTQLSLGECLAVLREEGWSEPQEVDCDKVGVHKFLLSRKK